MRRTLRRSYHRARMHRDVVVSEFTHQSQTFDGATVMSSAATLGALLELVPASAGGHWLEAACGTGVVARALAAQVDEVLGIDLTAAMLAVGRREARAAMLDNIRFQPGDATALELPDASFDGAVTRFSLHHIPVPGRLVAELARVVSPGGWVILGDHVADEDAPAAAWHQEIERLRDPSHWSCLTPRRIRALGERAGLELDEERLIPFELDFDEWLTRSSAGIDAAELISFCLAERPAGTPSFTVVERDGSRRLQLRHSLTRWRRP
jgi:SAM-dependent methyltransferase